MIADAAHVRSTGNLPDSLGDTIITPHLDTAESRLRAWVGETVYETAETEAEALDDPRDFSDTEPATKRLANAEAYLCIAIGLPAWNLVMEGVSGGSAAGITMTGQIGPNTYRFANPAEVEKMQENFLRLAEQAAADYLLDSCGDTPPGSGVSYAQDKDGYDIDEDWPDN